MNRRTRIVATLGPATDAGLDVARINFSHGFAEEPQARIKQVRQLARERKRNVAILGDLPGPKLRAVLAGPLELETGRTVTLKTMTEVVTVERSEVDSLEESPLSLMPEGLLEALGETDARNLIAYLMARSQVPLPPEAP